MFLLNGFLVIFDRHVEEAGADRQTELPDGLLDKVELLLVVVVVRLKPRHTVRLRDGHDDVAAQVAGQRFRTSSEKQTVKNK